MKAAYQALFLKKHKIDYDYYYKHLKNKVSQPLGYPLCNYMLCGDKCPFSDKSNPNDPNQTPLNHIGCHSYNDCIRRIENILNLQHKLKLWKEI
jgi:hypothetical protein